MKRKLACSLLVAGLKANSDNSLSRLLGMGNLDLWLNLEQQQDDRMELLPETHHHIGEAIPESNELPENKITFTRHSGDDWQSSDDDSSDDCPECFEEIGEGIVEEWGDPGHRKSHHYSHHADDIWGNKGNKKHFRKHDVGESVMSKDNIRSETGHGGRSSFGPGGGRGHSFSFNTDDIRSMRPNARHFETKGHRWRNEYEDEFQARDAREEQADDPVAEQQPSERKHRHRHRHHHHANEMSPYERHREYMEHYLVMEQVEDPGENLTEHESRQLDFYLDNGIMLLEQQIAQDQKDLYKIAELQEKGSMSTTAENKVLRHDFSEVDDVEEAQKAAEAHDHPQICDGHGVCHENKLELGKKDALALKSTLLATVTALTMVLF